MHFSASPRHNRGERRLILRQRGRLLSDTGRRLHFSGEVVIADRPRFSDAGREVFSQRLFERPEQSFPQGVVVGKLDAIVDMTDGETGGSLAEFDLAQASCRRP